VNKVLNPYRRKKNVEHDMLERGQREGTIREGGEKNNKSGRQKGKCTDNWEEVWRKMVEKNRKNYLRSMWKGGRSRARGRIVDTKELHEIGAVAEVMKIAGKVVKVLKETIKRGRRVIKDTGSSNEKIERERKEKEGGND